jgi:GNAT superfamily N-acetyltransferase
MNNVTFRPAREPDIFAMSTVRLAVLENRLRDPTRITYDMYVDYLDKLGRSWICECDGKLVGFGSADKHEAFIWALFVDPAFEGRGIGKHLLRMMADYLFELGHEKITLSTGAATRADAFYAAQGWQRSEVPDQTDVQYTLHNPKGKRDVHIA